MATDWITTEEAEKLSGYHPEYIRKLIRDGDIAARKFGIVWQVSKHSLIVYIRKAEKSIDRRRGPKSRRT